MEVPNINLEPAARFVELLTGDRNSPVTVQTYPDRDEWKGRNIARIIHGTLAEKADELTELNRQGASVCISVNETDLLGRRRKNIVSVRAFLADFDKPATRSLRIRQSLRVETSPGRFHDYWLIQPGFPLAGYEDVLLCISEYLGSDQNACNLNQVMRLPGFLNWKHDPVLSRLEEGSGLRYAAEDVIRLLPITTPDDQDSANSDDQADRPPRPEKDAIDPVVAAAVGRVLLAVEGERNATLYEQSRQVGLAHGSREEELETALKLLVEAGIRSGLPKEEAAKAVRNGLRDGSARSKSSKRDHGRIAPPQFDDSALYGLAGEYVKFIEPYSEAHPAGVLLTFLVAFGASVGRKPHFKVSATRHGANENVLLVGGTSTGRKGVTVDQGLSLFKMLGEPIMPPKVSGLSSGEGLIWAIRDEVWVIERVRDPKSRIAGHERVLKDVGVPDKRLLVVESEMGGPFRAMGRDKNILSPIVRSAWDGETIQTLSKNSPAKATDPHVSIIGSITPDELRRHLNAGDALNGFVNRFLFVFVERTKFLPHGDSAPVVQEKKFADKLEIAIAFAREVGEVRRDEEARALWAEHYPVLGRGTPGMAGVATARAEAHVGRLAMIYALLDLSDVVRVEHLTAALSLWVYCRDSAVALFGRSTGDSLVERIARFLEETPAGRSRTEIYDFFSRNKSSEEIRLALKLLEDQGRAYSISEETGGRPSERWFAGDRKDVGSKGA